MPLSSWHFALTSEKQKNLVEFADSKELQRPLSGPLGTFAVSILPFNPYNRYFRCNWWPFTSDTKEGMGRIHVEGSAAGHARRVLCGGV